MLSKWELLNYHGTRTVSWYSNIMQPSNYEKIQKASAEIPESCKMTGQTIREAQTGWITRSSRHSTRTFRKRWSIKENGIILVCKFRKK